MNAEKTVSRLKALLLFSGLFNIVFALPLLLPCTYQWYLNLLGSINAMLGLGGLSITMPVDGVHALLINTAGIDLVLIGAIVVFASLDPVNRRTIPLLNAVGRTLFFIIIAYYIFAYNIARVILFFGIADILISIGFIYYYYKLNCNSTQIKGRQIL